MKIQNLQSDCINILWSLFLGGCALKVELLIERGKNNLIFLELICWLLSLHYLLTTNYIKDNRAKIRRKVISEFKWLWIQSWKPYNPWFR